MRHSRTFSVFSFVSEMSSSSIDLNVRAWWTLWMSAVFETPLWLFRTTGSFCFVTMPGPAHCCPSVHKYKGSHTRIDGLVLVFDFEVPFNWRRCASITLSVILLWPQELQTVASFQIRLNSISNGEGFLFLRKVLLWNVAAVIKSTNEVIDSARASIVAYSPAVRLACSTMALPSRWFEATCMNLFSNEEQNCVNRGLLKS